MAANCIICNDKLSTLTKPLLGRLKDGSATCPSCFRMIQRKTNRTLLPLGLLRWEIEDLNSYGILSFVQKQKEDDKEEEEEAEYQKQESERLALLCIRIKNLLIENSTKMTISDIDAFLKHQDVEEIKCLCEEMYQAGEISFAGNGRYFILTEEKEKPKKASAPKSEEVDVEKELEKLKALLDKGLITQEQYDAKSNKLLGLD